MGDEDRGAKSVRHDGVAHLGPARSSPYPVSRLAPTHDLVDTAAWIAQADRTLATVVHGKLEVIAVQIRGLQAQARTILAAAEQDAALHRARCAFQRRAGHVYHLYRRDDGETYFSILSPDEWGTAPHVFIGSYRLEADASWTPAGGDRPPGIDELLTLAGVDGIDHP